MNERPTMPTVQTYERSAAGFSLIELMVVVLIIAILMAIAIPTFLSARTQASNRATEARLHNAVTDEQTFASQSADGAYGPAATLVDYKVDAALQFSASWPVPGPQIYVAPGTDSGGNHTVLLGTADQAGHAFWVYDDAGALTYAVTAGSKPTSLPLPDTSWP